MSAGKRILEQAHAEMDAINEPSRSMQRKLRAAGRKREAELSALISAVKETSGIAQATVSHVDRAYNMSRVPVLGTTSFSFTTSAP